MAQYVYRYTFGSQVTADDIEAALVQSIVSIESLHGESLARMDLAHFFDRISRCCVIDASTKCGQDLNRLFVGCLKREFGADAFEVRRIDANTTQECSATM